MFLRGASDPSLKSGIEAEIRRITETWPAQSSGLAPLTDSVYLYLNQDPATDSLADIYTTSLLKYLRGISKYNSAEKLKSGYYRQVIRLIPIAYNWHRNGMLLEQMKQHYTFVMSGLSTIPDTAAVRQFTEFLLSENPDLLFRYVEEFYQQTWAVALIERAAISAPESAKRYLGMDNLVRQLLRKAKDERVRILFEVFGKYGVKSPAYLLISDILQSGYLIETADSIGKNEVYMFKRALELAASDQKTGIFSLRKYIEFVSVDQMRKLNLSYHYSPSPASGDFVRSLSSTELMIAVGYGYRELSAKCFQSVVSLLMNNKDSISSGFTSVIEPGRLKKLIGLLEQSGQINNVMARFRQNAREEILAALSSEASQDKVPVWFYFSKSIEVEASSGQPDSARIVKERIPDKALESAESRGFESLEIRNKGNQTDIVQTEVQNESAIYKPVANDDQTLSFSVEKNTETPVSAVNEARANIALEKLPMARPAISTSSIVQNPGPELVAQPQLLEPVLPPFKLKLDPQPARILSLKKNIRQSLQELESFLNEPFAKEILLYAAEREPDELLRKAELIKTKLFCVEIMDALVKSDPVSVKRYLFNKLHPVSAALAYSTDSVSKKLLEINSRLAYSSKPLLLMDALVDGSLGIAEALKISEDKNALFRAMCASLTKPGVLARISLEKELQYYSLRAVREINDKIAQSDQQRFSSIESLSSEEIYFLMVYGREEVFKSTFNGLYSSMISRLSGKNLYALFNQTGYYKFRNFLALCSQYGKLEEALGLMSADQRRNILTKLLQNLDHDPANLEEVIPVAQILNATTESELHQELHLLLKQEYQNRETSRNELGQSVYGTLVAFTAPNAVAEQSWFFKTARRFNITSAAVLPTKELYAPDRIYEQMFFYNDEDGRASYLNFVSGYKRKTDWLFEDKGSFSIIKSSDQKVWIFANKPDYQESGMEAIDDYFKSQGIKPSIVIHRGHSFYTESTIRRISPETRLIFLGSCGGFYKIPQAMEMAPSAQYIATRQIGTKGVNDPLILELNDYIRTAVKIEWPVFWEKIKSRVGSNPMFEDYVPPHLNLEAQFIKAYFNLIGV